MRAVDLTEVAMPHWERKGCWQVTKLMSGIIHSIDLLDVVLLAALSLIASGIYQLCGIGWACVTLGSLLLSLVVIGVPTGKSLSG